MAKLDLNGDDEKVNVETIFWSAMDILSDDDKKLPQASSYSVSVKHVSLCLCMQAYILVLVDVTWMQTLNRCNAIEFPLLNDSF